MFQNISDLVIVLDHQGHIANFNLADFAGCLDLSQEAIGAAPEQALRQEWARFIRLPVREAEGLEKTRCPIDPARADKDSPGVWRRVYELTSSALKNRTGRTIGTLFLFHDISDREQLEHALEERVRERTHALEKTSQTLQQEADGHARAVQALWESEVKYRTLFETMSQGIIYQDPQGRMVTANAVAQRILGLAQKNDRQKLTRFQLEGDPRGRVALSKRDLPGRTKRCRPARKCATW